MADDIVNWRCSEAFVLDNESWGFFHAGNVWETCSQVVLLMFLIAAYFGHFWIPFGPWSQDLVCLFDQHDRRGNLALFAVWLHSAVRLLLFWFSHWLRSILVHAMDGHIWFPKPTSNKDWKVQLWVSISQLSAGQQPWNRNIQGTKGLGSLLPRLKKLYGSCQIQLTGHLQPLSCHPVVILPFTTDHFFLGNYCTFFPFRKFFLDSVSLLLCFSAIPLFVQK